MDAQIVKALEAAGQLTTRELAKRLQVSTSIVYGRCKRLEKDGLLASPLLGVGRKNIFSSR